jgi:AraC-like DNA-binding protein
VSISISLVRTLIEAVERAGVSPAAFVAAARLEPRLLEDPAARLELPAYDRLQELALDLTGDSALGLHMGDSSAVSAFQVVGHLASHCRTIREGLDVFFRYHRVVSDCPASYLEERGDASVLIYNYPRTTPRCSRLRAEFGMTRLFRIAQMFLRAGGVPREVWFEHEAPPYAAEYTRIFGPNVGVRFAQPSTSIVLPTVLLDSVQLHPNPQLFQVLKAQADAALSDLDATQGLAPRIHRLVVHHFMEVEPDMETLARRFGMSSRSLRRRLQEEGVTFHGVVNRAMGELACNVLREKHTSIQEAACRLGFAEVSSFHRAFKRWTGQTPMEFRHSLGITGAPT